MVKQWKNKCKDCLSKYGYSDSSYQEDLTKGFSRPERCPKHKQLHAREIAKIASSHFELIPRQTPYPILGIPYLGEVTHGERSGPEDDSQAADPTDMDLGITEDDIRILYEELNKYQVVIIVGPTGSGKSIYLPYRLIEPLPPHPRDLFTRNGQIIITQPRIQAVKTITNTVAVKLLGSSVGPGYEIGYRHRGVEMYDNRNRLVYVTDGSLLNWIAEGKLGQFSIIMVDEAHERNCNIDLILGILKKELSKYPKLKLIIASATIDAEGFINSFKQTLGEKVRPSPLTFKGKKRHGYKTIFWEGTLIPFKYFPEKLAEKVVDILKTTTNEDGILGFLPGENEINTAITKLESFFDDIITKNPKNNTFCGVLKNTNSSNLTQIVYVFPIYSALGIDPGSEVLNPLKRPHSLPPYLRGKDFVLRRVVIGTNIAETSLTITDIVYVIDSGIIKQPQWDPITRTLQIKTQRHSRDGCKQRWGRVGRTRPGKVFTLYRHEEFESVVEVPNLTPEAINIINSTTGISVEFDNETEKYKLIATKSLLPENQVEILNLAELAPYREALHKLFEGIKLIQFEDHTTPEITRSCLDDIVLTAKVSGISDLDNFPWFEKPQEEELIRSLNVYKTRQIVDADSDITSEGLELWRLQRMLSSFQDGAVSKGTSNQSLLDDASLLLLSDRYGCLVEAVTALVFRKRLGANIYDDRDGIFIWNKQFDKQSGEYKDHEWSLLQKNEILKRQQSLLVDCSDDLDLAIKLTLLFSQKNELEKEQWVNNYAVNSINLGIVLKDKDNILTQFFPDDKNRREVIPALVERVRILMTVAWPDRIVELASYGNESTFPISLDKRSEKACISPFSAGSWEGKNKAIYAAAVRVKNWIAGQQEEIPSSCFMVRLPDNIPKSRSFTDIIYTIFRLKKESKDVIKATFFEPPVIRSKVQDSYRNFKVGGKLTVKILHIFKNDPQGRPGWVTSKAIDNDLDIPIALNEMSLSSWGDGLEFLKGKNIEIYVKSLNSIGEPIFSYLDKVYSDLKELRLFLSQNNNSYIFEGYIADLAKERVRVFVALPRPSEVVHSFEIRENNLPLRNMEFYQLGDKVRLKLKIKDRLNAVSANDLTKEEIDNLPTGWNYEKEKNIISLPYCLDDRVLSSWNARTETIDFIKRNSWRYCFETELLAVSSSYAKKLASQLVGQSFTGVVIREQLKNGYLQGYLAEIKISLDLGEVSLFGFLPRSKLISGRAQVGNKIEVRIEDVETEYFPPKRLILSEK